MAWALGGPSPTNVSTEDGRVLAHEGEHET